MNSQAFLDICEKSFSEGKVKLGPMQREIYVEKLKRFDDLQRDKIFEKVLETVKYFPKIADIYDAARDCGFLQTESDQFRPHRWKPADCGFCRGEGRIAIIWHCFYEEKETGRVEIQELVQVFAYSKSLDYKFKQDETRSIFRCKCPAGDAPSIPKGWPKWSDHTQTRRQVWA